MECCNRQDLFSLEPNPSYGHKMVSRRLLNRYPPWFDTRVFYIRVTNFTADGSTPDHLTLSYFPLGPDTVVTINGGRSSDVSDYCVSAQLRRDRVDTRSEEATYVNTDTIRVSGTVGFEVCCGGGNELLLSGVLELSSVAGGGGGGGGKSREKKWVLNCESHMTDASARQGCSVFNQGKGQRYAGPENWLPTVDVYVAGSHAGHPLILTDTLQLFSPRKDHNKAMTMMMDAIPGYESTEKKKDGAFLDALQVPEYVDPANKDDLFSTDYDPNSSMYSLSEAGYMGSDDGELSWFNAGVRVGVGISLGLCVGVGLGVGLLVSSYQTTAWNLKRRFF